jgi:serine/threonine protein kinase
LGCNVAVKQLNVDFDIRECNYIYNQWEFLIRFRHPQIVQLVGVILPTNDDGRWSCNIVMELMDRDLLELIDKRIDEKEGRGVPLTQRESIDIIKQIAKGIQHLHMKGCMHRDIKSKSILVNDHGNYIDAKVSSFMILDQAVKEGEDISMIMKTYSFEGVSIPKHVEY